MSRRERPRFHVAFPVHDLQAARRFYGELLDCPEGRSAPEWVDFDFYGHQIVAQLSDECTAVPANEVDGEDVPVRHFGLILSMPEWQALTQKLVAAGVHFLIKPQIRFAGQTGEQATCFFRDPSGNAIELKAFADESRIFAK